MGIVKREDYESVREHVADIMKNVKTPDGKKMDNRIILREEAYHGDQIEKMPDITVYFDNLHYGVNESLGHETVYSLETVKGPDDSNHGEYGMLTVYDLEERISPKKIEGVKIEDLAPTILELLKVKPYLMDGKPILSLM